MLVIIFVFYLLINVLIYYFIYYCFRWLRGTTGGNLVQGMLFQPHVCWMDGYKCMHVNGIDNFDVRIIAHLQFVTINYVRRALESDSKRLNCIYLCRTIQLHTSTTEMLYKTENWQLSLSNTRNTYYCGIRSPLAV